MNNCNTCKWCEEFRCRNLHGFSCENEDSPMAWCEVDPLGSCPEWEEEEK